MNITELKAQAYDLLAQIEFLQGRLRDLNSQIAQEQVKQNNQKETTKETADNNK